MERETLRDRLVRRERSILVAAGIEGVPWVTFDPDVAHQCNALTVLTFSKSKCKRAAHWKFDPSPQSTATAGWLCWSHLNSRGFYADGVEQLRLDTWLIENGWREPREGGA